MTRAKILLIIILAVFAAPAGQALAASSTTYRLINGSFSSSGGVATSSSYRVTGCLASESPAGGLSKSQSYVLHAACAAAKPTFLAADNDLDNDGVLNGIEDGAPNNGDGNNDGIQDRVQSQVVSLPNIDGNGYTTIEACGDAQCTSICQVTNVRVLLEADLPQQSFDYEFPHGLLAFTLNCSPVDIRFLYHSEDRFAPFIEYVNYGPNPPDAPQSIFYDLPGATFGSDAIPGDDEVASVRFRLVDGALGDDTGMDGSIFSLGGPALPPPAPVPAMGLAGVLATIIMVFLLSVASLKRCRLLRRKLDTSGQV